MAKKKKAPGKTRGPLLPPNRAHKNRKKYDRKKTKKEDRHG